MGAHRAYFRSIEPRQTQVRAGPGNRQRNPVRDEEWLRLARSARPTATSVQPGTAYTFLSTGTAGRWPSQSCPGNLQDAAGARVLIPEAKRRHPALRLVLGDKAYRQRPLRDEMAALSVSIDGDSPPLPKGTIFRPMPMRWSIEQFFAWFCKSRRIAKNWCFSLAGFTADVAWVLLGVTLRRSVQT